MNLNEELLHLDYLRWKLDDPSSDGEEDFDIADSALNLLENLFTYIFGEDGPGAEWCDDANHLDGNPRIHEFFSKRLGFAVGRILTEDNAPYSYYIKERGASYWELEQAKKHFLEEARKNLYIISLLEALAELPKFDPEPKSKLEEINETLNPLGMHVERVDREDMRKGFAKAWGVQEGHGPTVAASKPAMEEK